MTSLIKHLLKIDSKSNQQITKNHEILSAANIFSYSILKSGESTNENKKVVCTFYWFDFYRN